MLDASNIYAASFLSHQVLIGGSVAPKLLQRSKTEVSYAIIYEYPEEFIFLLEPTEK